MLKFLLPLIAAFKASGSDGGGRLVGYNVALAWMACREKLRAHDVPQRAHEAGHVNAAD